MWSFRRVYLIESRVTLLTQIILCSPILSIAIATVSPEIPMKHRRYSWGMFDRRRAFNSVRGSCRENLKIPALSLSWSHRQRLSRFLNPTLSSNIEQNHGLWFWEVIVSCPLQILFLFLAVTENWGGQQWTVFTAMKFLWSNSCDDQLRFNTQRSAEAFGA
jgi:hypothetical protein